MKHLIETTNPSGLATVPYDRIVLDSTENDVIVKGGGYEYVNLGLPSGLKWAKCNVGAEKETDYGYYFQWGDIVDKSNAECSWSTYKHCNSTYNTLTKYCTNSEYGTMDNKTVLDLEDDAAAQIMGGDWRMPTQTEIRDLITYTTKEWVTDYNGSGVNGTKFTGPNGNSIFIPAAGGRSNGSTNAVGDYCYIWSSSLGPYDPGSAWKFFSRSGSYDNMYSDTRYQGLPVRGVFK